MGFPTAFWGLMAYLTLAATAFIRRADRHWWAAWGISFFGVLYSAYLTTVSLTLLHAACPYCLTSLVLHDVHLCISHVPAPHRLPDFSWPRWLARPRQIALGIILVLQFLTTLEFSENHPLQRTRGASPRDPPLENRCEDVRAFWCPHCQQQKTDSARQPSRLPYVECSPNGQNAPQAESAKLSTFKAIQPGSSTGSISRKF